ncbi:UMP kinase [Candidatus Falkowbacteria bacterium CG10_big_fil_rev_8_21_14_0_10_43_10]|uniref:Uridylate kinase n=1 Tax=Candidatus Falkowbacteria bacterium CG10_big_fil_rev_8_21_14_0_10_43_10 TaxID=1974567 RepID=A0A2H0V2B3_9BACT|nr:MAG: UMP kinase [Candidatus Falkowbacteria bacterium CG10_big_fil_rev_8_21_14_0_10_43_10]
MTYIISLGGSLIAPSAGIDWKYLKKFRGLIMEQIQKGNKFILVAGGGAICREYQRAAEKVVILSDEDKDWLGIHSTRLNAHLLRTIFFDVARPEIITNPAKKIRAQEAIIVAAGWKPGRSTDYDAVILAKRYKAKAVINLSNINCVYDKDPKEYKNARKIEKINWADFRKIVGNKWIPGLNRPFDPIASQLAEKLKLQVVIMNGKKLGNFEKCLDSKKFQGTVIK